MKAAPVSQDLHLPKTFSDVRLTHENGLELTQRLRSAYPDNTGPFEASTKSGATSNVSMWRGIISSSLKIALECTHRITKLQHAVAAERCAPDAKADIGTRDSTSWKTIIRTKIRWRPLASVLVVPTVRILCGHERILVATCLRKLIVIDVQANAVSARGTSGLGLEAITCLQLGRTLHTSE